jgi:predicted enzyme related to lactoylglutathione lyase
MSAKPSSFVWYELLSTDVAAAKAFYGPVIGWNIQDVPMPGMTYSLIFAGMTQVGGMMALPKDALDAAMKPFWAPYIEVDECDASASALQRLGGKIHLPPTDISNVGRYAVAADPQGAMFNLFKPQQSGERRVSNAPGQVGWHELHTNDWQKMFDFYREMFGWQKGDSVDMGKMGTYQLFTIDGTVSGGMFNSPGVTAAPYWLMYFNVPEIDSAVRRINEAGGKITMGPHQVPGGNWIVMAADPQGGLFALSSQRK